MRRRRWPNHPHWQRLASTCRETHRSRWRTAAAALVGCEKRDLRALIDCDLHPVEIKKLDAVLIGHLHRYAAFLQARAEEICNVARSVMRATNGISTVCEIEFPDDDATVEPWQREAIRKLLEDEYA